MWEVRNKTPFAAHGGGFRDHAGASFWSVWIAATFALRADRAPLFVIPQMPVQQEPLFVENDPERVLIRDSDITPPRARIDLTFRGAAPETQDADRPLLFRIGDWQKRLTVGADRDARGTVALDGTTAALSDATPLGRSPQDEVSPRVTVAGGGVPALGPVARHWAARSALGGTYDAAWQRSRAPLLPADMDPAFWQAAPADQRLGRPLAEGATLDIGGLAQTGPVSAPTRLPLPWLTYRTTTLIAGRWHPAAAALQSIEVDLDTGQVRLVHQAIWPILRAADDITMTRTLVALGDTRGFRVGTDHAALFDRYDIPAESTT